MGRRRSARRAWALVAMAAAVLLGQESGVAATRRAVDDLESAKRDIRLKNFADAERELRRLAEGGNAEAEYLLGTFLMNGLNGKRDPLAARQWLEKAAAQGHAPAAFSLSNLLAESDPPDREGAARWLARARELGYVPPTRGKGGPWEPGGQPDLNAPGVREEALCRLR